MPVTFLWAYPNKSYLSFIVFEILKTAWERPPGVYKVVNNFWMAFAVDKLFIVVKSRIL